MVPLKKSGGNIKKVLVVPYIIALLIILKTTHADRTVWYVHPDSSLNMIQEGLDSCADNDIVLVGPGVYYENIVWPTVQGIHLISERGPECTIIDGDHAERVITITCGVDSTTLIRGFTIQNGYHTESGSGIHCQFSSPVITGNIIKQCSTYFYMNATHGGGINCEASSPIITNNTIAGNMAFGGGGIHCDSFSSPIIDANAIIQNAVGGFSYCHGGGILCRISSATISSNTITDNHSEGIYCMSSPSAIISGNTISDNMRSGITCTESSSCCIAHNIINGNGWGGSAGAGIYCLWNSSPIIDSCTVSGNAGDGVVCTNGSNPTICNSAIFDNRNYGVRNADTVLITAEYNWWGDSTGPYHPDSNPGGLGDTVSDYVDFTPWLYWPGMEERAAVNPVVKHTTPAPTILTGPLQLPADIPCKIFDITGREINTLAPPPGIYFIRTDGKITHKVIIIK